MATHDNSRREHPSTYVVQDRSNEEELHRLHIQDRMITAGMGGVLPEQPEPERFQRILDVGCGTGNTIRPFIQKWSRLPDDYDAICRQALQDMQGADFYAFQHLLTVWGQPTAEKRRNALSMDTH